MLDGGDGLMNKKNKGRIRVYSLIFFIFCIVFGKTFVYQVKEKNRLNNKIQSLQERKDKLDSEITEAKDNLKKVDTEEFIKKVAREKLKMIEKDEIVVKYKDNDQFNLGKKGAEFLLGFLIFMKNEFLKNLKSYNLEGFGVLLAVSGGKDSMTMLDLFNYFKYELKLNLVV